MSDDTTKKLTKPLRNEKGQLLPGFTANPGGRVKGIEKLTREAIPHDDWVAMAQAMRDIALGRLPAGVNGVTEIKPSDRVRAYVAIHDRGWGKPKIQLDVTDTTNSGIASLNVDDLDEKSFEELERQVERILHGEVVDVDSIELPIVGDK